MASTDVFMDTAGFLALWDTSDEHHEKAARLQGELARKKRRFVTTDYILDETITLLRIRHSHAAAADFLQTVTTTQALHLEWVDSDCFHKAADVFTRHADKEWSFTDCVSFSIMLELNMQDAFTTDHHFRQAGLNPMLEKAG